jgi:hypothetical protein
MKKSSLILLSLVLFGTLIITGCKKEDAKDLNYLTIEGSSNTGYDGTYKPISCNYTGPFQTGCETTIYYNRVYITFDNGSLLAMTLYSSAEIAEIPVGSYDIAGECETGFSGYFVLEAMVKSPGPYLNSGTLTVSKKGDIYNVDLNATFSEQDGGGTIKCNFSGSVSPMEDN